MDEHLNKALYIGVSLILFMLAFTAFLTSYRENEAFLQKAIDTSSRNTLYGEAEGGASPHATGDEVVCFILEKTRQEQEATLAGLYGSQTGLAQNLLPDMLVDGISYEHYDITSIQSADRYALRYVVNAQGEIIRMEFTKR